MENGMRILGLDFGSKTVGVAVTDPLGYTAQGVEIIRRDSKQVTKDISKNRAVSRTIQYREDCTWLSCHA